MRGTPFGEMSFCGSLGRKEVVGALLSRVELMALVSERRLGRNGILSLLLLFSLWSGEEAFSFSYPALFALVANKEVFVADV